MTAPAAPPVVRGGTQARLDRTPEPPSLTALVAPAAAGGAAVLAISSTGSMVIAAALFGIGTRSRWAALAALLATAAVAVRFSTATFDDIAGIQSVLGLAGWVGPPAAALAAWLAAAAIILSVRAPEAPPSSRLRVVRLLPAVAAGAMASAIVAGPGPSDLFVRIVATAVAVIMSAALLRIEDRPRLLRLREVAAVLAGLAAVALASWPG